MPLDLKHGALKKGSLVGKLKRICNRRQSIQEARDKDATEDAAPLVVEEKKVELPIVEEKNFEGTWAEFLHPEWRHPELRERF